MITGIRAPYLPIVPILAGHPDSILDLLKPKSGRSDFHFLMIKKIIILTDPGNRHYGNREKRYTINTLPAN